MKIIGKLPRGDYYVGDPCYVIRDDNEWREFLELLGKAEEARGGPMLPHIIRFKGHDCFVSSTNTGDGLYRDQSGTEYPVDAGMLAAIPAELVAAERPGLSFRRTFRVRFNVGADEGRWLDRGKRIKIGRIIIHT